MTNRQMRFFNMAREVSYLGNYTKARVGAIVTEGNRVISSGHNSSKTSPLQYKYNQYREYEDTNIHLAKVHAEVAALSPIISNPEIDWSKVSIYVYRETKQGVRSCARPCPACMKLINDLGIRNIYYTDWNGNYIREENL